MSSTFKTFWNCPEEKKHMRAKVNKKFSFRIFNAQNQKKLIKTTRKYAQLKKINQNSVPFHAFNLSKHLRIVQKQKKTYEHLSFRILKGLKI
jgi:hypothetical protein